MCRVSEPRKENKTHPVNECRQRMLPQSIRFVFRRLYTELVMKFVLRISNMIGLYN